MQIYKPEHFCPFLQTTKGEARTVCLSLQFFSPDPTLSLCGEAWKSQQTHARLFRDGDELSPHHHKTRIKDKETFKRRLFPTDQTLPYCLSRII